MKLNSEVKEKVPKPDTVHEQDEMYYSHTFAPNVTTINSKKEVHGKRWLTLVKVIS
jgi:hypothetical protein